MRIYPLSPAYLVAFTTAKRRAQHARAHAPQTTFRFWLRTYTYVLCFFSRFRVFSAAVAYYFSFQTVQSSNVERHTRLHTIVSRPAIRDVLP